MNSETFCKNSLQSRNTRGFTQVDVVGNLIDYKESETFEKSQLVFISKIGPQVIRSIMSAWKECVGSEMKLKN